MIPQDWFVKIKEEVVAVFPDLEPVIFVKCDEITGGVEDYRAFMHVFHVPNAICHTPRAQELSDANIEGILWHEFGHIIAGEDGDECDADTTILEEFGIELSYDDKNLQYVLAHGIMPDDDSDSAILDDIEEFDEDEDSNGSMGNDVSEG